MLSRCFYSSLYERYRTASSSNRRNAGRAARTGVEEGPEGSLVFGVFVDVGNAEFRLPEKRVIGPLEELPLLGDGSDHRFERGATIGIAERAALNFVDDPSDTAADGAEVLAPLLPEKPTLMGAGLADAPSFDEAWQWVGSHAIRWK